MLERQTRQEQRQYKGESRTMTRKLVVRTSQTGWLAVLATAYKEQTPVLIIDDAKVGIDPANDSLFEMGRKADLSSAEMAAAAVAVGMSVAGVAMVILAVLDPEPTSKLGLLIASGAVLALTGGLSAMQILARTKPPTIKVTGHGFEVAWA